MGIFGLRPESDSAGIGGEEVLVQEGWLLVEWLSSVSILLYLHHLYTLDLTY